MKRKNNHSQKVKKLKKECDELWAKIVKERTNHVCQACEAVGLPDNGKSKDAHHIEGRRLNVRWDLDTGMCLCKSHHTLGQVAAHSTAHSGQVEFRKIMVNVYGTEFLEDLKQRERQNRKWNLTELQELKESLQNTLNNLL